MGTWRPRPMHNLVASKEKEGTHRGNNQCNGPTTHIDNGMPSAEHSPDIDGRDLRRCFSQTRMSRVPTTSTTTLTPWRRYGSATGSYGSSPENHSTLTHTSQKLETCQTSTPEFMRNISEIAESARALRNTRVDSESSRGRPFPHRACSDYVGPRDLPRCWPMSTGGPTPSPRTHLD